MEAEAGVGRKTGEAMGSGWGGERGNVYVARWGEMGEMKMGLERKSSG